MCGVECVEGGVLQLGLREGRCGALMRRARAAPVESETRAQLGHQRPISIKNARCLQAHPPGRLAGQTLLCARQSPSPSMYTRACVATYTHSILPAQPRFCGARFMYPHMPHTSDAKRGCLWGTGTIT